MRRISILLILLSLLTSEGYSQTDSSFKNRIDSILLACRFEKVKKIKVAKMAIVCGISILNLTIN